MSPRNIHEEPLLCLHFGYINLLTISDTVYNLIGGILEIGKDKILCIDIVLLVNIKLGTNSGSLNIPSIDRIVAFKVAFKCLISDCFGNKINSFFHACVLGHTFGKSEKLEICKHFN